MDDIWEQEFDIASYKIDRNDSSTLNKFQNTLDRFFLEYWKVFNAIIRDKKTNGEPKNICDNSLSKSLELAADVWEAVATTTLDSADDLRASLKIHKDYKILKYNKIIEN